MRVLTAAQHDQGFVAQLGPADGLGQVEGGLETDQHVELGLHQGGVQLRREPRTHADAHLLVTGHEGLQDGGQKTVQGRVHRAQAQLTAIGIALHPFTQTVEVLQQPLPALEKALAGCGGAHAAAMAHQQGSAQPGFEHAHLLGDGRRAEVELARGFGHGAGLHDAQEIVYVLNVHFTHFLQTNASRKPCFPALAWTTLRATN